MDFLLKFGAEHFGEIAVGGALTFFLWSIRMVGKKMDQGIDALKKMAAKTPGDGDDKAVKLLEDLKDQLFAEKK